MWRVRLGGLFAVASMVLAACSAGTTEVSATAEPTATATPSMVMASATPSPTSTSPGGSTSPSASPSGGPLGQPPEPPDLSVGDWVASTVEGLRLREDPGLDGASIGLLRIGYEATVVDGPVAIDGYEWVQLAWPGLPAASGCATGPDADGFVSCGASGWVATADENGNVWLDQARPECPPAATIEQFLSIRPGARVSCLSGQELTLTGFVAPESEGRGCYPGYDHEPPWLGPCALSFLQAEESQYDATMYELAIHLHPDLGACDFGGSGATCPLAVHTGSWVEVTGMVDHPSAVSCVIEPWPGNEHAPDEAMAVYACRERFVVTSIQPGTAPTASP